MTTPPADPIPFVDLRSQYRRYREELRAAIDEVLEECAFIGGPAVERFERAFAEYHDLAHAVGVANGTEAIELALGVAGVGRDDEVIVPANTFIATAEAVSAVGARPVFVDVDPLHLLIDLEQTRAAIGPRTRAVIPVHLYGQLVPMAPILELARSRELVVIEDAAQAHGAAEDGRRAGSFGDFGCFSFYPGKNLGAYGDGGAVITRSAEWAASLRILANHGRGPGGRHVRVGRNSRLDGLQAAVLSVKLRRLDEFNEARRRAAAIYDELLAGLDEIERPVCRKDGAHVFHLYVLRVLSHRDELRAHLDRAGVATGVHYGEPLHRTEAYAALGYAAGSFPVTEASAKSVLSLPISPDITPDQQARVASSIREYFRGAR